MLQRMRRARSAERGQALVESAIVFPVMIFMVLGIVQLTLMQQARLMLEYAAFNAARAGSVWNMDPERMRKAAVLTLLPTMPTTPVDALMSTPLAVDSWDKLAARYALVLGGNTIGGALGRRPIEVEILNPTKTDFGNAQEIVFDDVGGGSFEERKKTQLTLRVTYMYELRLPVINWMMFESWLVGRSGIAPRTLSPLAPGMFGGAGVTDPSKNVRFASQAAIAAAKMKCTWSGIDRKMLAQMVSMATVAHRYYVPLVTTYTIRMQSNPFVDNAPDSAPSCN